MIIVIIIISSIINNNNYYTVILCVQSAAGYNKLSHKRTKCLIYCCMLMTTFDVVATVYR